LTNLLAFKVTLSVQSFDGRSSYQGRASSGQETTCESLFDRVISLIKPACRNN
jgi:hypothetical protein